MRSEFLGNCARYEGFAETVNRTQYLLPRMEHPALLRVANLLEEGTVIPLDLGLRQPTLDDVFLHLTVDTREEEAA